MSRNNFNMQITTSHNVPNESRYIVFKVKEAVQ